MKIGMVKNKEQHVAYVDPVRSRIMASVRGKDTKPEMTVRRLAHSMGYRFRLHVSSLPGRPDLAFPKKKIAIQVCGCFWHQHRGCPKATIPKTRSDFWSQKLSSNVARDEANAKKLLGLGWRLAVIWECEISDVDRLKTLLHSLLGPRRTPRLIVQRVTLTDNKKAAPCGAAFAHYRSQLCMLRVSFALNASSDSHVCRFCVTVG